MSKPQQSSSSQATASASLRGLFESARFNEVIAKTEGTLTPEAAVLRCRALLRLEHIEDIMETPYYEGMPHEAEILMLQGAALIRKRDYPLAETAFVSALELAKSPVLRDEIRYYQALQAWTQGDTDACALILVSIQSSTSPLIRTWALSLRSWIHSAKGEYTAQLHWLSQAWNESKLCSDAYTKAALLHSLVYLMSTLIGVVPIDVLSLSRAVDDFAWVPELRVQRFHAFRYMGYIGCISGDFINGFRYFKEAAKDCISDAWEVLLLLDQAFLSRTQGDVSHATIYASAASKLAFRVNWNATREERVALLLLADYDAANWSDAVQKFEATERASGDMVSPLISYLADKRLQALYSYARGRALVVVGKPQEAVPFLEEAHRVWDESQYKWRAALASIALAEATGSKSRARYAIEVQDTLLRSPWLESELKPYRKYFINPVVRMLSSSEREVLRFLCEGMSNKDIAERCYRSPNTVRNQIESIMNKLGVNRREQVIIRCAQEGLLDLD